MVPRQDQKSFPLETLDSDFPRISLWKEWECTFTKPGIAALPFSVITFPLGELGPRLPAIFPHYRPIAPHQRRTCQTKKEIRLIDADHA